MSPSTDAAMGELRSVAQAPSTESWHALLALLQSWPDEASLYREALPYAHATVLQWPDEVARRITGLFGPTEPCAQALLALDEDTALTRRRLSLLCLASDVEVGHGFNPKDYHWPEPMPDGPPWLAHTLTLKRWMPVEAYRWVFAQEHPALRDLALGLSNHAHSDLIDDLKVLPWWSALSELRLCVDEPIVLAIAPHLELTQLRVLKPGVEGSCLAEGLGALLDRLEPGQLRQLLCDGAWMGPDEAEIIATHPALSALVKLDMRYNMGLGHEGRQRLMDSTVLPDAAKASLRGRYSDILE